MADQAHAIADDAALLCQLPNGTTIINTCAFMTERKQALDTGINVVISCIDSSRHGAPFWSIQINEKNTRDLKLVRAAELIRQAEAQKRGIRITQHFLNDARKAGVLDELPNWDLTKDAKRLTCGSRLEPIGTEMCSLLTENEIFELVKRSFGPR